VAAHLAGGPTGLPVQCQAAQSAYADIMHCIDFISSTQAVTTCSNDMQKSQVQGVSTGIPAKFHHRHNNTAFSAAGPRVWNCLPTDLRQPDLSHTAVSDSPHFYFVSWIAVQCKSPFNCASATLRQRHITLV